MKPLTEEWIRKAEEDYVVAKRELRLTPPVFTAVCFHCQQSSFAVEIRYPGTEATKEEAEYFFAAISSLRTIFREYLKL